MHSVLIRPVIMGLCELGDQLWVREMYMTDGLTSEQRVVVEKCGKKVQPTGEQFACSPILDNMKPPIATALDQAWAFMEPRLPEDRTRMFISSHSLDTWPPIAKKGNSYDRTHLSQMCH